MCITELAPDDAGAEDVEPPPPLPCAFSEDGGRRSARLALLEPSMHVNMEAKAIKRRALRDSLVGCSPRLQARAVRDKLIDAVVAPLGGRSVAGLRAAAAIKRPGAVPEDV